MKDSGFHICLFVILVIQTYQVYSDFVTKTTLNGKVRGKVQKALNKNVDVFWGIPFANPPTGTLRFKKPEPVNSWTEVRDALEKPSACWQSLDVDFDRRKGVEMWNAKSRSEDCLFLNIWAPSSASKLPVLVWIYGGGYWAGSSALDAYDGTYLAAHDDVVVVSMNYRLGPFGYLYLGINETPGNLGLYDQQLALKWVKDNVHNFGGDPDKITIFGESAGAASVGFHFLSPNSASYFQNGVMMSGSPLASWALQTPEEAISRAKTLGIKSGCNTTSPQTMFECLQNVDASTLTDNQWYSRNSLYFDLTFGPIVDGDFFPDTPQNLLEKDRVKKGSLIAGVVNDEGMYWLFYGIKKYFSIDKKKELTKSEFYDGVSQVIAPMNGSLINSTVCQYTSHLPKSEMSSYVDIIEDVSGDILFKCPVTDFATKYANLGNDVYVYSFNHVSSGNPWPHWLGVLHGYEIDHFFALPWNSRLNYTDEEKTLSSDITGFLSNLARTGDPNQSPSGNTRTMWPKYTEGTQEYLLLETPEIKTKTGLRKRECAYWRDMVPDMKSIAGIVDKCGGSSHGNTSYLLPFYSTVLTVALSILTSLTLQRICASFSPRL